MIVEKPPDIPSGHAPNDPQTQTQMFQQDTHVFYASMPEPQVDVNLARQLGDGMSVSDLPPSYDTLTLEYDQPEARVPAQHQHDPKRRPSESAQRSMPSSKSAGPSDALPERQRSFERSIPSSVRNSMTGSSGTFEPLILHSKSKKLEDGFFAVPPHTDINPHPFVQRDVQEADWKR